MKNWNGKSAEWGSYVANYMILTVLWVVGCLPVATIGPSTAAVYGVIREWQVHGNDNVVRSFFQKFRSHFKQGFLIGNGWVLAGFVLAADLYVVLHLESGWNLMFLSIIGMAILLWLLVGTALFPCLIHTDLGGWKLLKASFVLAFSDIGTAVGVLFFWVAGFLLFWVSPVLMMACFVGIAYVSLIFSMKSIARFSKRGMFSFLHE